MIIVMNTAQSSNNRDVNLAYKSAFTIVELIVVIAIIAILSVLAISTYSAISNKAVIASLQSDLVSNSKVLKSYQVLYGAFPTSIDNNNCTSDPNYCLKLSGGNTVTSFSSTANTFNLKQTNNSTTYQITETTPPALVTTAMTYAISTGGSNNHQPRDMVKASDGGYAVSGFTTSFGDTTYGDMFLTKHTAAGSAVWSTTWGSSTSSEVGIGLAAALDGGYFVTGHGNSYGAGGSDIIVAKFTSAGVFSWVKTWGGTGNEFVYDIVQTSDGGCAVAGITYGYGAGGTDIVLVKYTSTGGVSWATTWGGAGYEDGYSLVQSSDGGYVVVGATDSYGDAAAQDLAVVKFTSSGVVAWSKVWGETGLYDVAQSITKSSDGGFVVAGYTESYGAGGSDVVILKYDSNGNLSWAKTWGGSSNESAISIVQASDGGYALTGRTRSYGFGQNESTLVKLTSSGGVSWAKTWGGANDEVGYSIFQSSDDGYFTVNDSTSFGGAKYIVTKYDSSGVITNCNISTMCLSPTGTTTSPSATVSSPTGTTTSPAATITSPSGITSSFVPTKTVIVPF